MVTFIPHTRGIKIENRNFNFINKPDPRGFRTEGTWVLERERMQGPQLEVIPRMMGTHYLERERMQGPQSEIAPRMLGTHYLEHERMQGPQSEITPRMSRTHYLENERMQGPHSEVTPRIMGTHCLPAAERDLSDLAEQGSSEDMCQGTSSSSLGHTPFREKRLSGAQRRKLRIQQAIAAGVRVLPRSERCQKKGVRQTYREIMSKFRSAGNPEFGAASQTALKTERVQESGDKMLTELDEEKEHAVAGTSQSSKEQQSIMKLAVVPKDFPEKTLTEEQSELLQDALLERITPSEDGEVAQFLSTQMRDGALIVVCANSWTKAWLENVISEIQPWEDADLEVKPGNILMRRAKVLFWVPKLYKKKEASRILELLQNQNKNLKTEDWKVVTRKEVPDGVTLVLAINEQSFKALEAIDFKPFLGMGRATFRVLSRPPESK